MADLPKNKATTNSGNILPENEIRRLQDLKKAQAEKRIIEHLMYSGKPDEDQNRNRVRKNRKKRKPNQTTPAQKKDFDVDSALAFIEGRKPAKKQHKKKTKKKRNNKSKKPRPRAMQEVKVKSAAERQYHRVEASEDPDLLKADFTSLVGTTVVGRVGTLGVSLPELDVRFEAASIDRPASHLFLSCIDRNSTNGLCFHCEQSQFISCPDPSYQTLVNFCKAYRVLLGGMVPEEAVEDAEETVAVEGEATDAPAEPQPEAPPEDVYQEVEDDDIEAEGLDDIVFVTFEDGTSLEYEEVGGYVHAYESEENCLCYCFSKEEQPRRFTLSYINNSTVSFLKKHPNVLDADLVIINCNHLNLSPSECGPGELSWKSLQPYISEKSSASFLLTSFHSTPQEVFTFFDSLVEEKDLDLSHVTLFLPRIVTNEEISTGADEACTEETNI